MLHALVTFAAEAVKDEHSKTAFYITGILLALWAVGVSAVGISRHREWPPNATAARGVMSVTVLLVAAAMLSAVLTG